MPVTSIKPDQDKLRALKAAEVRGERDRIFSGTVDKINGPRWEMMDDAERERWTDYRRALLDITGQEGFPFAVTWPVVPGGEAGKTPVTTAALE
jgi:hypothetical protein